MADKIFCMGSLDRRPSARDGQGCSYYCRQQAQADGVYFENVHGVVTSNMSVTFKNRLSWYGQCAGQDAASSDIDLSGVTCAGL